MADDRICWPVESLAPKASERILEIGCGHGVAVTMVCDRLIHGRMFTIDRSAAMIEAARRRNVAHIAAGRAEFQVAELGRADFGSAIFDKALALRVGIFSSGNPERELAVLAGICRRPAGSFCFTTNRRAVRVSLCAASKRLCAAMAGRSRRG